MGRYRRTLELEQEFHRDGRLERFWGNHDDNWRHERDTEKHLHPLYPGSPFTRRCGCEIVEDGKPIGMLFLVHGHQGTLDSDRYAGVSRLVVRNVWRPFQQRFKIPSTTPLP